VLNKTVFNKTKNTQTKTKMEEFKPTHSVADPGFDLRGSERKNIEKI